MIEIPEETILADITDVLMNELPTVLLELEEQSTDAIHLPSFRYVGVAEKMPKGISMPYALLEIEEGTYSEKDRIIKSELYLINLNLKIENRGLIWYYFAATRTFVERISSTKYRTKILQFKKPGTVLIQIGLKKHLVLNF